VLYNHFSGHEVPYVPKPNIEALIADAMKDTVFSDSTDSEIDTAQIRKQVLQAEHSAYYEYSMMKAVFEYVEPPLVNKPTACRLLDYDTGTVAIPENGFVVSFGNCKPDKLDFRVGDICTLCMETSSFSDVHFRNAVSGTPRLVRQGNAYHEANAEGSHSKRFISSPLPRTAIGTNKDQTKTYLVTVEISNRKCGRTAASLEQMAQIMNKIGCYSAMNLDGGGSTSMVIGGKNLIWKSNPDASRKMAVGVAAVRKKSAVRNVLKQDGTSESNRSLNHK
jgi:hypothetical protein